MGSNGGYSWSKNAVSIKRGGSPPPPPQGPEGFPSGMLIAIPLVQISGAAHPYGAPFISPPFSPCMMNHVNQLISAVDAELQKTRGGAVKPGSVSYIIRGVPMQPVRASPVALRIPCGGQIATYGAPETRGAPLAAQASKTRASKHMEPRSQRPR